MRDGHGHWIECCACGGKAYHATGVPVVEGSFLRGWRMGHWPSRKYRRVQGNEQATGVLCLACLDVLPKRTIHTERVHLTGRAAR